MKLLTNAILFISLIGFAHAGDLKTNSSDKFLQNICKSENYEVSLNQSNELSVENFITDGMTVALFKANGELLAKTTISDKRLSFDLSSLNKDNDIFYTLIYENGQHHEGSFSLINSKQETLAFN